MQNILLIIPLHIGIPLILFLNAFTLIREAFTVITITGLEEILQASS